MTRKVIAKLPTERQEQIWFVTWLKKQGYKCSASANGGSRNLLEAINFKKMGVSKGFPDVEVPLPIPGFYHGFYVEMKRQKGGKVSEEQEEWLSYLREKGYFAEVAKGFEEARAMFLNYISLMPKVA